MISTSSTNDDLSHLNIAGTSVFENEREAAKKLIEKLRNKKRGDPMKIIWHKIQEDTDALATDSSAKVASQSPKRD